MKNVTDLIESAATLSADGLANGEIADELNVSRETASWLVRRSESKSAVEQAKPDDIHVDWSAVGRSSARLAGAGRAIAGLSNEVEDDVDVVVGIEKAGVPLATTVARELEADLSTYNPRKHRWEEGDIERLSGNFSQNFAAVEDRRCFIVDDTITSGTTMGETIGAVRAGGGTPVACGVLVDKYGTEEIEGVPAGALIRVIRVGE